MNPQGVLGQLLDGKEQEVHPRIYSDGFADAVTDQVRDWPNTPSEKMGFLPRRLWTSEDMNKSSDNLPSKPALGAPNTEDSAMVWNTIRFKPSMISFGGFVNVVRPASTVQRKRLFSAFL